MPAKSPTTYGKPPLIGSSGQILRYGWQPPPPLPAPDPIRAAARIAVAGTVCAFNLATLPALFGLGLVRAHMQRRRP